MVISPPPTHPPEYLDYILSLYYLSCLSMESNSFQTRLFVVSVLEATQTIHHSIHSNLHNVILCSNSLSLISWNLGNKCAQFKSPSLLLHFPLIYIAQFWHWNNPPKNSNLMLAYITLSSLSLLSLLHYWLCDIPYITCYLASMLTLQTSYISRATLLPKCMILGRLECTNLFIGEITNKDCLA